MYTNYKKNVWIFIYPPSYTCSDSHEHSACIWPDTLCISVHLYEKYAILVIILHCYIVITPGRYIFSIFFFFSLVHAKPPTKKNLMKNKTRKILFLCLISKKKIVVIKFISIKCSSYKVSFN